MTHIVIHSDKDIREKYLLKLVSYILGRDINIKDLLKIPDIHVLNTPESSIGIEQIKSLQKEMVYQPFEEKSQISIIFDSQKLTQEAQNAFLKTLEEQPDSTVYILLLNEESNLLDTILSRGIKHLVKEKATEQLKTEVPEILSKSLIEKFEKVSELSELSISDISLELKAILKYFREQLKLGIRESKDILNIKHNIEVVETAHQRLEGNGNKKLVLENMFVQLID